MIQRSKPCIACKGSGYFETVVANLKCVICNGKGSVVNLTYEFNYTELKALMRHLERSFIPYDDEEVREIVNKISKIVNQ